jgi:hypothetical protein
MLKYVDGRIITKVDITQKNGYTFEDGTVIELVRNVDNFDRKYTQQVLGVVMSAENIPKDALVLFHHNSVHETYEVLNHSQLSGSEIASGIKIYSIMERDCFFWKMPNEDEWHPTQHYETALRVFQPYNGLLNGIEPKLIKNCLYVTSGEMKGQIVQTVEAADYCITFRDPTTGRDKEIIRFRPFGIEEEQREPEAVAILSELTKKAKQGKLLIGLTKSDAKPLKEMIHA